MYYICGMNATSVLKFYEYQGTGNDFILVDNRRDSFPKGDIQLISNLCDRKFGIGADGLILLEHDDLSDFRMIYYNSDGNESTMCGNGGRCIVAFAKALGIIEDQTVFRAIDGEHQATIEGNQVRLKMIDVDSLKQLEKYSFLNTGSPHHVQLVANLEEMDVKQEGERIRYGLYGKEGSNINFVSEVSDNMFQVRTYERGVEDETLSCGTGVTAVALAMHDMQLVDSQQVKIKTRGGELSVQFKPSPNGRYSDIWLIGTAQMVFKGEVEC